MDKDPIAHKILIMTSHSWLRLAVSTVSGQLPSLIFGQDLLEDWPCLVLDLGGISRLAKHTGQTGLNTGQTGRTGQTDLGTGQTGRFAVVPIFLVLPPSVEAFPVTREVLLRSTFFSDLSSPMIIFFSFTDSS